VNGPQCRAARALVGISQDELSDRSDVSKRTIASFELESHKVAARTMTALVHALESAGVEFIDENGGGPGVRMRK